MLIFPNKDIDNFKITFITKLKRNRNRATLMDSPLLKDKGRGYMEDVLESKGLIKSSPKGSGSGLLVTCAPFARNTTIGE